MAEPFEDLTPDQMRVLIEHERAKASPLNADTRTGGEVAADMFERTRHAQSEVGSWTADGSLRHVHRKHAGEVRRLSLRKLELSTALGNELLSIHTPLTGTAVGSKSKVEPMLAAASVTSNAGAQLIVVEAPDEGHVMPTGEIAWRRKDYRYINLEPAGYTLLPDGEDVTASAVPRSVAAWNPETAPNYAVQFTLSRDEQRQFENGELPELTMISLVMGIGRAADQALLRQVAASTPGTWSIAAAAAAGLNFDACRAVIGSSGTGASVRADGQLIAGGLPAALTPMSADTYAGDWSRVACGVQDTIILTTQRTGLDGSMLFTAHIGLQPLIPNLAKSIWKVTA